VAAQIAGWGRDGHGIAGLRGMPTATGASRRRAACLKYLGRLSVQEPPDLVGDADSVWQPTFEGGFDEAPARTLRPLKP
jgi:hypothetical protein